jgi:SrtB family sortase
VWLAVQAVKEAKIQSLAQEAKQTYYNHALTPAPTPPSAVGGPFKEQQSFPDISDSPMEDISALPTPTVMQSLFVNLRQQYDNDDIVGYLKIEGTTIDYPVTCYTDNERYLHWDINKKESVAGWVFMDFENDVTTDDYNTVIYGHNMRSEIMFHDLRYYQDKDYFNEHRYIVFDTLYEYRVYEVFAFYSTNYDFPYITVRFDTEEAFLDLVAQMKEKSWFNTGVEIGSGDRILTLSTCTNITEDTRFVVHARKLAPDEIPVELRK